MIGFMYATGVGNVVKRDQAQALLYHTFAAHGSDTAAEMTLGYRHLLGIGTEQKCEDAIYYYQRVAEKGTFFYRIYAVNCRYIMVAILPSVIYFLFLSVSYQLLSFRTAWRICAPITKNTTIR